MRMFLLLLLLLVFTFILVSSLVVSTLRVSFYILSSIIMPCQSPQADNHYDILTPYKVVLGNEMIGGGPWTSTNSA